MNYKASFNSRTFHPKMQFGVENTELHINTIKKRTDNMEVWLKNHTSFLPLLSISTPQVRSYL